MGSRKRHGLSRRRFLKGAAAASAVTVAGRGIYSLLDEYPGPTRAYAATTAYREEQYLIDNLEVVSENNDCPVNMRSDDGRFLSSIEDQLFGTGPNNPGLIGNLFDLTSKRIGFAGRGFGTPSAGKQLALAAGVDGAASIPDNAQL